MDKNRIKFNQGQESLLIEVGNLVKNLHKVCINFSPKNKILADDIRKLANQLLIAVSQKKMADAKNYWQSLAALLEISHELEDSTQAEIIALIFRAEYLFFSRLNVSDQKRKIKINAEESAKNGVKTETEISDNWQKNALSEEKPHKINVLNKANFDDLLKQDRKKKIKGEKEGEIKSRLLQIIGYFKAHKKATAGEIRAMFSDLSGRTIRNDLHFLVKKGVLSQRGRGRGSRYYLIV